MLWLCYDCAALKIDQHVTSDGIFPTCFCDKKTHVEGMKTPQPVKDNKPSCSCLLYLLGCMFLSLRARWEDSHTYIPACVHLILTETVHNASSCMLNKPTQYQPTCTITQCNGLTGGLRKLGQSCHHPTVTVPAQPGLWVRPWTSCQGPAKPRRRPL